MSLGGNSGDLMSEINVTPFVDVMLVLLIIFMVTAPMMVQGVDVALPETTSSPLPSDKEHLVVTIDRNQKLFINDYQVSVDFLQEKLKKILATASEREVYLKADKTIPYGVVVHVMAEIKAAGIENLGMVTEPVSEDRKDKKKTKS